MASLMILNPRPGAKKRRRKMTAKQLKFFGPRKGKKKRKKKAARAKSSVIVVRANPKGTAVAKKKRHHRRRKAKVFTHNPKRRRHFRRNPRSIEASFINNTLLPAAIGAAGAVGTDMLLNYLPIPPQFKTGMMLPALKIGASLAVGWLVGMASNRQAGEEAAAGGVIVTLYRLAQGFVPAGAQAGMGRYAPMNRYTPMRRFNPNFRGIAAPNSPPAAFLVRPGGQGMDGMGYQNPARVAAGPMPPRGQMRFLSSQRG